MEFKTWADEMTKASKFENVFCKLSGLNDEVYFYNVDELRPYVKHCLGKIDFLIICDSQKSAFQSLLALVAVCLAVIGPSAR